VTKVAGSVLHSQGYAMNDNSSIRTSSGAYSAFVHACNARME
jgi:hypothetical protein